MAVAIRDSDVPSRNVRVRDNPVITRETANGESARSNDPSSIISTQRGRLRANTFQNEIHRPRALVRSRQPRTFSAGAIGFLLDFRVTSSITTQGPMCEHQPSATAEVMGCSTQLARHTAIRY
jgi:hypothetical protein